MNRLTNTAHILIGTPLFASAARGLALFLGSFALAGTFTAMVSRFDPNIWWVDLRWLPFSVRCLSTGLFGIAMIAFAVLPAAGPLRKSMSLCVVGLLLLFTFVDTARFGALYASGRFAAGLVVPFSLFAMMAIGMVFVSMLRSSRCHLSTLRPIPFVFALITAGITFPMLQVYCFGKTDYERYADTAVVFGARVFRSGNMSVALRDRVARACVLYEQGFVTRLIFSGGPGDGTVHETEAMRNYALEMGIPDDAIWTDLNGLNTEATVANSLEMLYAKREYGRIIAVSEFYHLPRIKLTFQSHGRDVLTVPAWPSHPARNFAFRSILREVPAFWVYLARSVSNNVFC